MKSTKQTYFLYPLVLLALQLFAEPRINMHEGVKPRVVNDKFGKLPDQTFEDTVRRRDAFAVVRDTAGFAIGGANSSDLIGRLTQVNGIDVGKLEERMRPEQDSTSGFLNRTEKLLDVLKRDNDYVRGLGLTHQVIAQQLRVLLHILNTNVKEFDKPVQITYRGIPLELFQVCTKGFQMTPFEGGLTSDHTAGSCNVTIKNMTNNRSIEFGDLLIPMIERYGFYEGSVPYRLNPADILATLTYINRDFR